MIRINLFPHLKARKARGRSQFQFQLFAVVAAVVGALLLDVGIAVYLQGRIISLKNEKTRLQAELDALKLQVKEVENFERDNRILEEKKRVIEGLKRSQTGPVHLLDEVSRRLPDRVWLQSLVQRPGGLDLEGKAVTNSDVVQFIDNLKASGFFPSIQLVESRQQEEKTRSVYQFKLACTVTL